MSRRIGVVAAIACVLVLCFALVGCGGGVDKSKFVGSWELVSSDAEGLDANAIETMKSLDLTVTLTLNNDDTGTLDLFGEDSAVAWKATNASEGTISMEGVGDANLKFEGDNLVMVDDTSSMTFAKQ